MQQVTLNDAVKLTLTDLAARFEVIGRSRKDTLTRYERLRQELSEFAGSLPLVVDERVARYETNDKSEARHFEYILNHPAETDAEARHEAKKLATWLVWKAVKSDHLKTVVYEEPTVPEQVPVPVAPAEVAPQQVADAPKPPARELTATEKLAEEAGKNLEQALANVGVAFGLLRHYSIEDGHCYSVENSLSLSRASLEGIWATKAQCERLFIPTHGLPTAFISIPISSETDDGEEDAEVVAGRFKRIRVFNVAGLEAVKAQLKIPARVDVGAALQKIAREALAKSGCPLLAQRRELAEYIAVSALANAEGMSVEGYDLQRLVAAGRSKNGKGLRKAIFAAKEALKTLYSERHWERTKLIKTQEVAC